MKALVYDGIETLTYRDMPDPVAGKGDVLVRIARSGICGSDMHAYLGHDARRPAPLILGHEAAGTIIGGARDGELVTINPLVTCRGCRACKAGRENICVQRQIISMPPRAGAFAQYVAIPDHNAITLPEGADLSVAAMAEPMAVCWHAARLGVAALHKSQKNTALVIGGGAIGLGSALSLRAMGIGEVRILETQKARAKFLRGKCFAPTEDHIGGEHHGGMFDIVVDAVGYARTREIASKHVAPGGVFVHIGLAEDLGGVDVRRMTLQEITMIGTYTYTARDFRDTVQAMQDGRLGPLDWFETRPLSDGAQAFADIRAGSVAAPKIILDPWG